MLKCWSTCKSACLKEEHHVSIDSYKQQKISFNSILIAVFFFFFFFFSNERNMATDLGHDQ